MRPAKAAWTRNGKVASSVNFDLRDGIFQPKKSALVLFRQVGKAHAGSRPGARCKTCATSTWRRPAACDHAERASLPPVMLGH